MKPVEDVFSSDALRRIIMPGIIITLGIHPLIATWISVLFASYGVGSATLLVTEIVFFGLVLGSGIQGIYYMYEGIIFERFTIFARRANEKRVARLIAVTDELRAKKTLTPSEHRKLSTAFEQLIEFPVRHRTDGSVEYYADSSTRLGNIIATYELYAQTRYGVDGVFHWFHLLNLAPDAARKEFVEQYAFAESLVLASFSGALVSSLHALVLVGFWIGRCFPNIAVAVQTGPITSVSLVGFGVAVWVLFYQASLPAHREAGKILQSVIDSVMPSFVKWVAEFKAPLTGDAAEQIKKIRTYLAEPSRK